MNIQNKKCCVCEQEKPATKEFFHIRSSSTDGFRCDCKVCRKLKKHKNYQKLTKKCSCCNIEKPNTEEFFNIRNGGKAARTRSLCKECHKRYSRQFHLLKKYDLTITQYENIAAKQEYRCKICNNKSEYLVVDHCHRTNIIRGLLCDTCNTGIGLLKENVETMKNAINYLTNGN